TEKLSVVMARRSLERADVAVVVIDATEGVAALDANIAGYAVEAGCSIIIAVNKWDAVPDKETGTPAAFERDLRDKMKFLDYAPAALRRLHRRRQRWLAFFLRALLAESSARDL